MRNPNGYGGIKKLSGNRRKPYAACITKEWTDDGKQVLKYIGYYATRKEAVQALAEYNADPFSATADKTFKEIYDGWHKDYFFGDYNAETERNYSKGFKRAKQLHDKVFVQIRLTELQDYIDTLPSHDQARRFKALVSMMSEWAIARDYARKNYAEGVVIKQVQKKNKQHRRVADADIEKIFTINTRAADIIKIDLYAGCRISELLNLKREDLHLDEKWFYIRDSKTNAGVRVVPIHERVLPLWNKFADEGREYVFTTVTGRQFSYSNFKKAYFTPTMEQIGKDYDTHDCRYTLISRMNAAKCNQTIIKKIVGHSSALSLTERIYTQFELSEILEEINKIS